MMYLSEKGDFNKMIMVSGPRFGMIQVKNSPKHGGKALLFDFRQEADQSLLPKYTDPRKYADPTLNKTRSLDPVFTITSSVGLNSVYVQDATSERAGVSYLFNAEPNLAEAMRLAEMVLRRGVSFTEDPAQKQVVIKKLVDFLVTATQQVIGPYGLPKT